MLDAAVLPSSSVLPGRNTILCSYTAAEHLLNTDSLLPQSLVTQSLVTVCCSTVCSSTQSLSCIVSELDSLPYIVFATHILSPNTPTRATSPLQLSQQNQHMNTRDPRTHVENPTGSFISVCRCWVSGTRTRHDACSDLPNP